MIIRLVLIALVLALFGGAIHFLQQRKAAELAAMTSRTVPPAAVTVAEVQAETWRQALLAVGSLVAEQGIDVVAPLPGSVVELYFDSGQEVTRGQKLLAMDVGIEMAELDGLIAAVDLRETQFERAKRLLQDKQIAQSDFDAARAARDEAKAQLAAKRAYVVRKTVYAPFDGTLGIRLIGLGTYLEPGDPIVPLQMLDPIHVDYGLPERYLSRLALGQAVEVTVPAYPGETFRGRITAFDPGVDPATRNVRIRATFANAGHRLRPGMFAEVSTIEAEQRAVLALPETAVTYSPYGNSIFVVVEQDGASVVERRQVETGDIRDGRVEITVGTAAGERVVAVGQNKLRNGMAVNVVENMSTALSGEVQ